jgi:hypothetical protein
VKFDRDKLKALVLYVIWRAGQQEGFGATKINKVLWFADARRYEVFGQSITGETYVRQPHGPVPQHIDEIKRELESDGSIKGWSETYYDKSITRHLADAPPDTSMFDTEELMLVDWWIKHVAEEHTATSISDLSHNYAWNIAAMGEEIPLHAVFADRVRSPNDEELEWARTEAKRLGLS